MYAICSRPCCISWIHVHLAAFRLLRWWFLECPSIFCWYESLPHRSASESNRTEQVDHINDCCDVGGLTHIDKRHLMIQLLFTFSSVSIFACTIFTWTSRGGSTERYVTCLSSPEIGLACECTHKLKRNQLFEYPWNDDINESNWILQFEQSL